MLVAFSVAPSGGGADEDGSVHKAVAAAVKVVRDSGLPNQTDSMFTTIEGDWDEVFAAFWIVPQPVDRNRIAGDPGFRSGQQPVFVQQSVDQRGFARVRAAHDGEAERCLGIGFLLVFLGQIGIFFGQRGFLVIV